MREVLLPVSVSGTGGNLLAFRPGGRRRDALVMVAWSGDYIRSLVQLQAIWHEHPSCGVRDKLAENRRRARKPTMMLLPYGIRLRSGSIAYFGVCRADVPEQAGGFASSRA